MKEPENEEGPKDPVSSSPFISKHVRYTGVILLVFFAFIFILISFVHIDSASVAPGKIVSSSKNKMIQHQQGGVIKKIYVTENQTVDTGQPLIELDESQVYSKWISLKKEEFLLLAKQARLQASINDKQEVLYPEKILKDEDNLKLSNILEIQTKLFVDSKAAYLAQIDTLKKQLSQLSQQISQAKTQKDSNEKQLQFLTQELEAVKILEAKKLVNRPRLLGLQREEARLTGEIAKTADEVLRLQEQQEQIKSRMIEITETRKQELLKDLENTEHRLLLNESEIIGAEDLKEKIIIRSPTKGIVQGLQYHSVDEVISPGTVIMQIVPLGDPLVVEAEVNPNDIDWVFRGLTAKIVVHAFSSRYNPYFYGQVVYVSPDTFLEKDKHPFYLARIANFDQEWKNIESELLPGMIVEVLIINNQRTILQYLMTPIIESLRRAFKEK